MVKDVVKICFGRSSYVSDATECFAWSSGCCYTVTQRTWDSRVFLQGFELNAIYKSNFMYLCRRAPCSRMVHAAGLLIHSAPGAKEWWEAMVFFSQLCFLTEHFGVHAMAWPPAEPYQQLQSVCSLVE